ncbi:MAG: DUF4185 domain-containing protein, partial [Stackebrandtia sp.]
MKRSTFLKAAAVTAIGGGLAAGGTAAVAQQGASARKAPKALEAKKIADLTGPDLTTRFRMEATDLGIPATTPD